MRCERHDCQAPDAPDLNHIHHPGPQGELDMLVCTPCAQSMGWYCVTHDTPHQGFRDGTHACAGCIEDVAEAQSPRETEIIERLRRSLPSTALDDLRAAGYNLQCLQSRRWKRGVLSVIAAKACRLGITFDEVIEQLIAEDTAKYVLT